MFYKFNNNFFIPERYCFLKIYANVPDNFLKMTLSFHAKAAPMQLTSFSENNEKEYRVILLNFY